MKFIIRAQYFIYFGAMGIFLPYFNLYCYHIGFSGIQIGAVSAVRSVVLVIFPVLWGALADRLRARRWIYIVCNTLAALIWGGYLYTTAFWPMMVITFFHAIFYSPIISFLEAFTMEVLGKEKRRYGKTRAWGSFSFISVVILVGRMIDVYSVSVILPLILVAAFAMAFMSWGMPEMRAKKDLATGKDAARLFTERLVVFLFCAFMMLFSHGAYYGFFSIHLETLGYGKTFIGITWALASSSEILVMVNSERIFKKFSLESVLVFSLFVAAVRWFVLAVVTSAPIILAAQLLHAVTYGAFHISSILYIDALSPETSKTMGQAANNAVTYGLGLMVGFFLSGFLYDRIGSSALFMMSGWIALAGGLVLKLYGVMKGVSPTYAKEE